MAGLSEIAESLVERDIAKTEELTRAAIDANIPVQEQPIEALKAAELRDKIKLA